MRTLVRRRFVSLSARREVQQQCLLRDERHLYVVKHLSGELPATPNLGAFVSRHGYRQLLPLGTDPLRIAALRGIELSTETIGMARKRKWREDAINRPQSSSSSDLRAAMAHQSDSEVEKQHLWTTQKDSQRNILKSFSISHTRFTYFRMKIHMSRRLRPKGHLDGSRCFESIDKFTPRPLKYFFSTNFFALLDGKKA